MKKLFACLLLAVLAFSVPSLQGQEQAPPKAAPTPADAAMQEALKKLEAGDLPGAIQRLEALRKDPATATPPVLALLGALYLEAGRTQDSLAVLEPLTTAAEPDPAVLYNAGRAALAAGQTDKARGLFERSLALLPASPAARELGLMLAREGRIVEAYKLLRPWSIRNPGDTEALVMAVTFALRLERTAEAEEMLAALPQGDPAVRLLRGELLVQKGDGKGALAALQPLQANHPPGMDLELRRATAEAHLLAGEPAAAVKLLQGKAAGSPTLALLLGRAQRQAGDVQGATATLKPFADQLPADAKGLGDPRPAAGIATEYGRLLIAAGDRTAAIAMFRKATALHPNSQPAWEALGEALAAAGQADEAGRARARAQEIAQQTVAAKAASVQAAAARSAPAPGNAPAAQGQKPSWHAAQKLMEEGKPEEALKLARQGIAAEPKEFGWRSAEVRSLLMLKRSQDALKSADAAMTAMPGNPDAVYQRGVVKMTLKDLAGAERDLRQAIQLAPNHVAAMNDLAVLLMAQGKKDEPRKLLQRVLQISPKDPMATENMRRIEEGGKSTP
ncbi:MAG TPA: tetratricopeptide repeat protein [Thermoanaerobaculia bacterium]|nr:tetratricopeptide repeat protein [Thermoanaerobaculia bacterium]